MKKEGKAKCCCFCGYNSCAKCLYKKRKFAPKNGKQGDLADICKICDRKFMMRRSFQNSKQELQAKSDMIKVRYK